MLFKLPLTNEVSLKVGVATTPEDRHQGLSGLEKLGKGKGLLLMFNEIRKNWDIVNRDMNFPIEVIGLRIGNSKTSAKVTGIFKLPAFSGDKTKSYRDDFLDTLADDSRTPQYETVFVMGNAALEVNLGVAADAELEVGDIIGLPDDIKGAIPENDVKVPDSFRTIKNDSKKFQYGGVMDLETDVVYNGTPVKEKDVKIDKSKMLVLNSDGTVQMNIAGGNRIFSREHTKMLLDLINKVETDDDIENIGRILVTVLDLHNHQPEEYVED